MSSSLTKAQLLNATQEDYMNDEQLAFFKAMLLWKLLQ